MSLSVVSFFNFKPAPWSRDWTQQELAEFYRVEASLIRANIPIETDRGRSDEGDPWFIFCNGNTGEIIVHFARFDGTYVVASPALDGCARGRDFRALVEAQIASHPLLIPKTAGGGQLFVHPAALLILLVTTCFFKLSQTTALAGPLHEAPSGSLSPSASGSQAVMLDERAAASVLAAIVTGITWAQSHGFNLWSTAAALPTKIDVPSPELPVSTSAGAASQLDAKQDHLFHIQGPAPSGETLIADIMGGPSTASPVYRSLNSANDYFQPGLIFTNFDISMPSASKTAPAMSGQSALLSPYTYALQTEITTSSGSTVSSGTTNTPVSSQTTDAVVSPQTTDAAQENGSSVGQSALFVGGVTPIRSIVSDGATATYVLTTGDDTNASLGHSGAFTANDLITGVINAHTAGLPGSANTFNVGDSLVLSGATLSIVDIRHLATTNELAGVSLTGPFTFVVHELAAGGGSFDFTLASGATNVELSNSTDNVIFANLAAGTNAEISGSATSAGTIVNVTYALPTTAESFQVDGGVSGVSFKTPAISTDAPTTETILSTGATNGTAARPDWFHVTNSADSVTSIIVNATTSLVAGLWDLDFNATAGATTLTVSGAAASVDLTPGGNDPFSTVSASGLTNGALHLEASGSLASFAGGGGGGNELLYDGEDLSASATAINGGGGTGNIVSAQLVNASNGGIFTDWQTLDITNYGGTPFDASLLTNDAISGLQWEAGDSTAETVLNIAPAATAMVAGTGFTAAGLTITHSSATGDSLAVMFNNTDTATSLNDLLLTNLTSTSDATVSIASTGAAGNTAGAGYNGIGTLTETDGYLTTVKVTGSDYLYLGYNGGVSTNHSTFSTANITSALTTVDASATTGGVEIYAGNTTLDASGFEVSYQGLTLDGGSGNGEILYNGANSGVTSDGNGNGDAICLGGSNASGTLGTGASDMAYVGDSAYATAATHTGPEAVGVALGDTVTFKAGATATIVIEQGAEWDGTTYVGGNVHNGVGRTTVGGAVTGMEIDFSEIIPGSSNIQNQQTAIAGASNLETAENDAVAALGAKGVAYFTFGGNEFLVAAHTGEAIVSVGDAVVELHEVNFTGLSMIGGVVHVA